MALGEPDAADHFPVASRRRAQELVANLRAAYEARIEKLTRVNDAARQMALAKNPAKAKSKIDGCTQDQRFFLNWPAFAAAFQCEQGDDGARPGAAGEGSRDE